MEWRATTLLRMNSKTPSAPEDPSGLPADAPGDGLLVINRPNAGTISE